MTFNTTHIEALSQIAATGNPFAVVTLVATKGSTPQDTGTKMIVDRNGLVHGTVGGGKVENATIEFAKEMIENPSRSREIVDWNLQTDVGMTCGGVVQLFFEVFNRDDWKITVFGAGHVAQAVIRILLTLDCRIKCVDQRSEWLDRLEDNPSLEKVCTDDLASESTTISENDFVLCMTMGHSTDRPVLAKIFKRGVVPAYLGVIGSRTKRGALIRELKTEDGIDPKVAEGFICPMGLKIGTNQPAEIAISIVAQLLERRDALKSSK